MKREYKTSLILIFMIFHFGCTNEEIARVYPIINTLEIKLIDNKEAFFSAEIEGVERFEIVEYGFVFSESENPLLGNKSEVVYADNMGSGKFSAQVLFNFDVNKTIYVRPFVRTNLYLVYGVIKSL